MINETDAMFGLIQVVYADVTDQLAVSLYEIRRRTDCTVTFESVFRSKFGNNLNQLIRELRKLKDVITKEVSLIRGEDVDDLLAVCSLLQKLSLWRNERIHARVRRVPEGLLLYNGRTGKPLSLNRAECERVLTDLASAVETLRTFLPIVITGLDQSEEYNRQLEEFVTLLENQAQENGA